MLALALLALLLLLIGGGDGGYGLAVIFSGFSFSPAQIAQYTGRGRREDQAAPASSAVPTVAQPTRLSVAPPPPPPRPDFPSAPARAAGALFPSGPDAVAPTPIVVRQAQPLTAAQQRGLFGSQHHLQGPIAAVAVDDTTRVVAGGRVTTIGEVRRAHQQATARAQTRAGGSRLPSLPVVQTLDRTLAIDLRGNVVSSDGRPVGRTFGKPVTAREFFGRAGFLERNAGEIEGAVRGASGAAGVPIERPTTSGPKLAGNAVTAAGIYAGALIGEPVGIAVAALVGIFGGSFGSDADEGPRYHPEAIEAVQRLTSGLPLNTRQQLILSNLQSSGLRVNPQTLLVEPDPSAKGMPTAGGRGNFPSPIAGLLPKQYGAAQVDTAREAAREGELGRLRGLQQREALRIRRRRSA